MPISSPSEPVSISQISSLVTTSKKELVITKSQSLPTVKNFEINQGSNFSEKLNILVNQNSLNLGGYSLVSYVKKHPSSTKISSNFGISTTSSIGEIILSLGSTMTSQLKEGRYFYDVLLINNVGPVKTVIIEGMIFVKPGIST